MSSQVERCAIILAVASSRLIVEVNRKSTCAILDQLKLGRPILNQFFIGMDKQAFYEIIMPDGSKYQTRRKCPAGYLMDDWVTTSRKSALRRIEKLNMLIRDEVQE